MSNPKLPDLQEAQAVQHYSDPSASTLVLDEADKRLELWQQGNLCDITIVCGGKVVAKAFKADLACWSEYFRKLFSSSFEDAKSSEVKIEDADPQAMAALVTALYERKVTLTCSNAPAVLALADRLQIDIVLGVLEPYLMRQLTYHNAVETLLLAEKHSLVSLRAAAVSVIICEFGRIDRLDISLMPFDVLEAVLLNDNLAVREEVNLLMVIEHWSLAQGNPTSPEAEDQLLKLIGAIRFQLIEPLRLQPLFGKPWMLQHPRVLAVLASAAVGAMAICTHSFNPSNRNGARVVFECWNLLLWEWNGAQKVVDHNRKPLTARKRFKMPVQGCSGDWELHATLCDASMPSGQAVPSLSISCLCRNPAKLMSRFSLMIIIQNRVEPSKSVQRGAFAHTVMTGEDSLETAVWAFWPAQGPLPLGDVPEGCVARDELVCVVKPVYSLQA